MAVSRARTENGGEFFAVRSEHTRQPFSSCARLASWLVAFVGTFDGNLSCASKFAWRSGRWTQRRRSRGERQREATALPKNPRRRTSRALGDAARRRCVVDHELYPSQSTKRGIPVQKRLDWLRYFADNAIF